MAAKEKYEKNVAERQERISGYQHWAPMTSAFESPSGRERDSEELNALIRVQEDFVPALLEQIAEIEEKLDQPFVFIVPPQPRNRKPLYYSHDAGERMLSQRKEMPRIRHRRPRWKTLRGQWA